MTAITKANRMISMITSLLVSFLLWNASPCHAANNRDLILSNNSPYTLDLFWIHPTTGDATKLSPTPITPGTPSFPVQSFVGHRFQVRQTLEDCDASDNKECHVREFQVLDTHDQKVEIVGTDFDVHRTDHTNHNAKEDASSVIESCQSMVESSSSSKSWNATMDKFLDCVEQGVAVQFEKMNEEIAYQAKVRKNVANLLENYTCADTTTPTSPDVETREWVQHPQDEEPISRTVHVKHERTASRIHYVKNFISDDECRAMEEAAKPKLHRATVADGKGGSHFSENRKAMQAGIQVHWEEEHSPNYESTDSVMKHHIATLSRRVYDYANHVLGLDIQPNGQEDLMSIQYFGRGANDTTPDRYTPHCDGDCTGLPHKTGTRMATMVMYCIMPTLGGATNFRNSGVHVHGQKNDAVFFSYIDPTTKLMDSGFTEHSGCPVVEGEKKIVTQWIRYGVDDENPWSSFNTLGIKYSEAKDQ